MVGLGGLDIRELLSILLGNGVVLSIPYFLKPLGCKVCQPVEQFRAVSPKLHACDADIIIVKHCGIKRQKLEGTRAISPTLKLCQTHRCQEGTVFVTGGTGESLLFAWSQQSVSLSSACRGPGVPSPVRMASTSMARTVSPVTASAPLVLVPSPPVLPFIPLPLVSILLTSF